MINIDLQRIYLNNIEKDDLYCLTYLDMTVLGCPTKIYKTFKTLQELKNYCEDNTSERNDLCVNNFSKEEIEEIEKGFDIDYSNYD